MAGITVWINKEPSPEELAEQEAARAEAERLAEEDARKLAGVEFEGVMCSATGQDQAGLTAVLLSIQLQGATFPSTRFKFDNGNSLVISLANYQAFTKVWVPFRQSFFKVEK